MSSLWGHPPRAASGSAAADARRQALQLYSTAAALQGSVSPGPAVRAQQQLAQSPSPQAQLPLAQSSSPLGAAADARTAVHRRAGAAADCAALRQAVWARHLQAMSARPPETAPPSATMQEVDQRAMADPRRQGESILTVLVEQEEELGLVRREVAALTRLLTSDGADGEAYTDLYAILSTERLKRECAQRSAASAIPIDRLPNALRLVGVPPDVAREVLAQLKGRNAELHGYS
eukprot:TRINITY_DN20721_c0_g1_i1.p1 TRINITY_DN20721_c0_g1~~TRINITY_DN20721_c0_g1_i1.p1  ORF type:complete len:248 (+),score=86.26 TRINITY_DN20721_c0_g1_i1:43-744(+)